MMPLCLTKNRVQTENSEKGLEFCIFRGTPSRGGGGGGDVEVALTLRSVRLNGVAGGP